MLTFEQFQSSRVQVADVCAAIGFEDDDCPRSGYVYAGNSCFIEDSTDPRGKYYLLVGRDDWFSADLAELERILYDEFYVSEIAGEDEA